jgi:hypothetical protein
MIKASLKPLLACVLFAGLVSACSSGTTNSDSPSPSKSTVPNQNSSGTTTAKPSPSAVVNVTEAASSIGCTNWKESTEFSPYTESWGQCTIQGVPVKIYKFASLADQKDFLKSVRAYGVTESMLAIKDLFIYAPDSTSKLSAIKKSLGIS